MKPKSSQRLVNKRLLRYTTLMIVIGTLVIANVLFTMLTKTHLWSGKSVLDNRIKNSIVQTKVKAVRGTIYDRNKQVIAQEVQAYTLVAYLNPSFSTLDGKPDYVKDVNHTAKALVSVLTNVNEKRIANVMKAAKKAGIDQTELGAGTKRFDKATKKKIEALKLPGIHMITTTSRSYPVSPFSSNLIGFAAYDEDKQKIVGKLGLEATMDKYLSGKDGQVQYQQTVSGDVLPGTTVYQKEAKDGNDVILTIDGNLQATVEAQVKATMEQNKAEAAWAVVEEPSTGRILAWASYPSFNQNSHDDIPLYTNYISEVAYEPGSVMKPITYSTVIDAGRFPDNTTYRAGTYTYTYNPTTERIVRLPDGSETAYPVIGDALGNDFGTISFERGLEVSSNVGICELLANYMNYKTYRSYLKSYRFFQPTNIPFVNEVKGSDNVSMPMGYLNFGFGQASSITILQLMTAYTAIFNHGREMRPYVVDTILDTKTGKVVKKYDPKVLANPISDETAEKVRNLMRGVVNSDGASASRYKMDGIDLIAKTGTGQIYNEKTGKYKENTYTTSVMAAAPGDKPAVMVYWGMVGTNYINFSEEPFKNIMKAALVAVNSNGQASGTAPQVNTEEEGWQPFIMPNVVNHSLDYAKEHLNQDQLVILGGGDTVVNQYPVAGFESSNRERIFLLTNGSQNTIPDLTGYSLQDVLAWANLVGIEIEYQGSGLVSSQSVEAGKTVTKGLKLSVTLT